MAHYDLEGRGAGERFDVSEPGVIRNQALQRRQRTRKEAFEMLRDAARLLAGDDGFELEVYPGKGQRFEAGSENDATFYALMLKRQRQARGLSLRDVSERLGMKSRNAYARYEQGRAAPTIQKFAELLKAVNPNIELVVRAG